MISRVLAPTFDEGHPRKQGNGYPDREPGVPLWPNYVAASAGAPRGQMLALMDPLSWSHPTIRLDSRTSRAPPSQS